VRSRVPRGISHVSARCPLVWLLRFLRHMEGIMKRILFTVVLMALSFRMQPRESEG